MSRRLAIAALLMAGVVLSVAPSGARGGRRSEAGARLRHRPSWCSTIPAAIDAKLRALASEMRFPVPSPLAMLKGYFGVHEGADESGTIALIVLPPEVEGALPTPVLLIPVTDYDKFLQIHETGKSRRRGDQDRGDELSWLCPPHRRLCLRRPDVTHREVLEKTLKLAEESSPSSHPGGGG